MTQQQQRSVVFGAGPLGLRLAEELAAQGHDVALATRSGTSGGLRGVTAVRADLNDPDAVRRVTAGARTVYFCASPAYDRWTTAFVPMVDGFIAGVSGTGARVVVADNLYAYGRVSAPITEQTPEEPCSVKGCIRKDVTERLREAAAAGRFDLVIARGGSFFGPRVVASSVGREVFQAVLKGKAVPCVGDIDAAHSFTYIDDFARALVILGTRDEAVGKVWHVPAGGARSMREMVETIARRCGGKARFMVARRWLVTLLGLFNPQMRELKEMLYQFEEPFVLDYSRFAAAFGDLSTPHEVAVDATLRWVRQEREQETRREDAPAAALGEAAG